MSPEQKIYARLKRELSGCFIQRIETSTGAGIPDVFVLCPDRSMIGWIETKTIQYNISKEQYAWARRYEDMGGWVRIVTLYNDRLLWLKFDRAMLDFRTLRQYIERNEDVD
jgi:hypothetical protein